MQDIIEESKAAREECTDAEQIGGEAIDPVCGTMIAIKTAIYVYEYQDRRYYFCSACCQFAFCSDPTKYARVRKPR